MASRRSRTSPLLRSVLAILVAASGPGNCRGRLLIAMPKSGSTSLLLTARQLMGDKPNAQHRVECAKIGKPRLYQVVEKALASGVVVSEEERVLSAIRHADSCDGYDEPRLREIVEQERVMRLHLLPTSGNREALSRVLRAGAADAPGAVVLVRNATAAADSAVKRHLSETGDTKEDLQRICASLEGKDTRRHRIPFETMRAAYERYAREWERQAEAHSGRLLIVHYEELVARPDEVMRRVMAFWRLPITSKHFSAAASASSGADTAVPPPIELLHARHWDHHAPKIIQRCKELAGRRKHQELRRR